MSKWFELNWADKITPEFQEWWFSHYGKPEDYTDDLDEYYVRMAFAFQGWVAREKTHAVKTGT